MRRISQQVRNQQLSLGVLRIYFYILFLQTEINTGIYGFDNEILFEALKEVKNNNAQNEYYITDLVEIIKGKGHKVKTVLASDSEEVAGVNDRIELARANKYMQKVINESLMKAGVTLIDPNNTYISKNVKIERDVVIYPNVYIEGNSYIKSNTTILPQTFIKNGIVGSNCVIDSCHIIDSEVKDDCHIEIGRASCRERV